MIERYTRPQMRDVWSEETKYDLWLKVELAVCEAQARAGAIPPAALKEITTKAGYDLKRIGEIETDVKHDVIAFLTAVSEKVGQHSRFIHLGLTSSDLVDTAFACQLTKAGKLIDRDLSLFREALKEEAYRHRRTPMMGRTHGIHAEPITFGLKVAQWYDEFSRQQRRLGGAIDEIAVGKISGAVGTYAHLSPVIEEDVCRQLELAVAPTSTQVIPRDRHAHFFSVLAGIAGSLERVAVEIRHLQRTEVAEVAEPFGHGQKGSSAMPHKRNPVLCENVTGLSRLVRSYAQAALENIPLWHERDISHSSVERVIAPDATILIDFMLARMTEVMKSLEVAPQRMLENLEASHGLYASQDLLLALTRVGQPREAAYRVVQELAMRAWNERKNFRELVTCHDEITQHLSADEIDTIFDLQRHLAYVDFIFKRVFGE